MLAYLGSKNMNTKTLKVEPQPISAENEVPKTSVFIWTLVAVNYSKASTKIKHDKFLE